MNQIKRKIKMSRKALIAVLLFISCAVAAEDKTGCLREKAEALHAQGKNDSALIVAEEALHEAEASDNRNAQLGVHSSMGVYLRTLGRTDDALRHYNKALELCTDAGFMKTADEDARQEVAVLYLNIATLHVDMQHKEQATVYARKADEWAGRCNDKEFKAQLFSRLGTIFVMCGDIGSGRRVLTKSYEYSASLRMWDPALAAAANMVMLSEKAGKAAERAEWEKICTALLPKAKEMMSRLTYYQVECGLALNKGDDVRALAMFDEIMSLDGIAGMPFVVYDCYNNIHEIYARRGDYRRAYDYLMKAGAVRDSLYEADKAESLRELTVKYDAKEKELALSESRARLARMQLYVTAVIALLVIISVGVYVYVLRSRHRAHAREAEFAALRNDMDRRMTEKYISGLEGERNRLARELHDGLCNDLYTIELRLAASEPSSPSVGMLAECREQARRISHELMPPEFRYATIDEVLSDYVERIVAGAAPCRVSYGSQPHDASWKRVPDGVSFGIYRIVQEALSNALKHSGATEISVRMSADAGCVTVEVSDNGRGGGKSSGIGVRTMRQRAEAVGGRISVEGGDDGTVVRFDVNIRV